MEISTRIEFGQRIALRYRGRCTRTEEGLKLGSFLIPKKYILGFNCDMQRIIFSSIVSISVENLEAGAYVNGNIVLSFPADDAGPCENLAIPCSKIAQITIDETKTSTFKLYHDKKKLPQSA